MDLVYVIMVLFLIFMTLRMPIAFAFGVSSLLYILAGHGSLVPIAQKVYGSLNSQGLLAVPFFILVGELMNRGGVAEKLIDFVNAIMGHVRGGLAQVNVVVSIFEAGMSGVAASDIAAECVVLVPAMERAGYPRAFSAAVTAASSTMGPVIPPSVPMIIIASMNELSVGRLFAAGFLPGLLMALFMAIYIAIIAPRRGFPRTKRPSLHQMLKITVKAFPCLMAPVIILGGMITGFATATEAGVIGVVYVFVIGKFLYKRITLNEITGAITNTVNITAASMFIVAVAGLFGWILTLEQFSTTLCNSIVQVIKSPYLLLFVLNVIMIIMGCFINITTIIILLSPIVFPLIISYGIDPIHFGLLMVVNLMIGLLTPPVGMVTYLAVGITKCDYKEYLRELWPFMIALLCVLALITYVPSIVLIIPNLIYGPMG